jgi:FkbM family methyltransferase
MKVSTAFGIFCNRGDSVLDVGANVGRSSEILSALVGESVPHFYLQYCRNMVSRPNVMTNLRAISDTNGYCSIHEGDSPAVAEASTIIQDIVNSGVLGKTTPWRVECESLDSFCSRHRLEPTFAKIDVEGAEHLVFRGASQLLMSKKSAFYFEFCNDGTRGSDHLRYLPALGYTLLCADAINFRGKSISMEINGMESVVCPLTDTFLRGADQGSVLNILAIPGEQIPSVQHRVTCISDDSFLSLLDKIASSTT